MAMSSCSEVLFENGESKEIRTNGSHNSINIYPFGTGSCNLQVKPTENSEWCNVSLFDGIDKFQQSIDSSRGWQGDVSNTFAFRISNVVGFTKVEARFV